MFESYFCALMVRRTQTDRLRVDRIRRKFAERLRSLRVSAGYDSRASFADKLGIEQHTYRRYERGEVEPPMDVLISIADLTGYNIHWMLTGDGESRLEASK